MPLTIATPEHDREGRQHGPAAAPPQALERHAPHDALSSSIVSRTVWRVAAGQVAHDLAVGQEEDPVGDRRGVRVVGHHDRRLAEAVDERAHELEDLAAGGGVEVAGGLVREHHRRARHERAGHRDALLLAAGHLARAVAEAVGEPDLGDELLVPVRLRLAAGDLHRQEDVLLRREHRQEVEELEDEADVVAAQRRQPGVVEAGDLGVADPHLPAVGVVQPGEDVHERRLARARRPHDGRQPPRRARRGPRRAGRRRPSRPRRSAGRRRGRARPPRVGSGRLSSSGRSAMPWGSSSVGGRRDVVREPPCRGGAPGTSGEPPDRAP